MCTKNTVTFGTSDPLLMSEDTGDVKSDTTLLQKSIITLPADSETTGNVMKSDNIQSKNSNCIITAVKVNK